MVTVPTHKVDDSHKFRAFGSGPKRLNAGSLGRATTPCSDSVSYPSPGHPTSYVPGSGEKVAVMLLRQRRKELLFHPYDARNEVCLRPLLWQLAGELEREKVVRDQFDLGPVLAVTELW